MRLDLEPQDAALLKMVLDKELEETRIEIHHTRNMEYKIDLQARERQLQKMIAQL